MKTMNTGWAKRIVEGYNEVIKAAEILANRWLEAWADGNMKGYRWATQLTIKDDKIIFRDAIRDGVGMMGIWQDAPFNGIDIKYLEDDTGLEADGRAWYLMDRAAKDAKNKYEKELENSPDVIAWKALQYKNNGYYPIQLSL